MTGLVTFLRNLPRCFRRCGCGERHSIARSIRLTWKQRSY